MTTRRLRRHIICGFAAVLIIAVAACKGQERKAPPHGELGYDDTPFLPGQKWRVHDSKRPDLSRLASVKAPRR